MLEHHQGGFFSQTPLYTVKINIPKNSKVFRPIKQNYFDSLNFKQIFYFYFLYPQVEIHVYTIRIQILRPRLHNVNKKDIIYFQPGLKEFSFNPLHVN